MIGYKARITVSSYEKKKFCKRKRKQHFIIEELRSKDELSTKLKTVLAKMIQKVPVVRATFDEIFDATTVQVASSGTLIFTNC